MTADEQLGALERGTVQVIPQGGLAERLAQHKPLTVKLGIDPTAPDIHLGFAVVLRKLRAFQDAGHTAVLIIGDFTAKIGDPSGRSKTRPVLTDEQIKANARTFKRQALKILDTQRLEIRYNSSWLAKLKTADLLRLCMQVTASQILGREDFQQRFTSGQPIGLHELFYPLLQAYDSVAIKADVELGGTDQTFNLLMGRELQEKLGLAPQIVMTMPLLVGLDGVQKMSKSLSNYIGVLESARDMYGKVMSLPDKLLEQYVTLCTDLSWESLQREKPMEAKKQLAATIVRLYHGEKTAAQAAKEFENVHQKKMPLLGKFPKMSVKASAKVIDFLTTEKTETGAPIFASRSEARRKIDEGAIIINGLKVRDPLAVIELNASGANWIRIGKKRYYHLQKAG